MKNYQSLANALDDLRKRGYEADFDTDTICLYCGDLDLRLDPEDFHVDEIYRFDTNSTPGDRSVLYAISSSTGIKGTMIDRQGSSSASLNFEMARKLQSHEAVTS